MRKQVSVETMVCSEYQRLLEESQGTLEIWHEHRAEICRSRLIGTKQATNSFDCKRSLLELTQYCRTTRTTACDVSWHQEPLDVVLKLIQPLSLKVASTANIEGGWQDQDSRGEYFPAGGEIS